MKKISTTPCDKKFRKWVAEKIKDMYDRSDTKEDFLNRLLFVTDNMLKSKTTVILRVKKS